MSITEEESHYDLPQPEETPVEVDGAVSLPSHTTPANSISVTAGVVTSSAKVHTCGSLFAKCRCDDLSGEGSGAGKALEIPTTVKQGSKIVAAGHHCTGSTDITSTLFSNSVDNKFLVKTSANVLPKRSTSVSSLSHSFSSYSRYNTTSVTSPISVSTTAITSSSSSGKRFSDPDIHKSTGGRLSVIARDLKGLQHPDIPYAITPEVLDRELQLGGKIGGALGRKGSNSAGEPRRHLPRYSKHISIDLDYNTQSSPTTSPLSTSQRSLNLDYHKYNALAYEEQGCNNTVEQPLRPASAQGIHTGGNKGCTTSGQVVDPVAHQFLRDFGIFGPMGNGVGHSSSSARKTSSSTADQQNGNLATATSNALFRRRNSTLEYERLKGVVVRLEREFGELEGRYGDVQGELFQCSKELKCKEQEIFRLHREIHKLKSVLQQKTNRSKDEDILSSLQEVHSMANRIPALQLPNTGNAASKKQGVSAESSDVSGQHKITISKHEKDFRSKQLIKDAIMDNDFLKNLDSLQVREIVDAMYRKEYSAGAYVLREGEAGAHLFVSAEGELEVIKDGKVLGSMGSGKAFGELAILYNCTRTASIRVVLDSKVWVLDRKVFQHIMVRTGLQRLEENINFLRSVPLLKNLNNDVLAKIADVLEIEFYPAGAYIIRQGANGDTFFILSSGSVRVTQKVSAQSENILVPAVEVDDEEEIRVLNRGDYFGEQALLKEDCRTASIIALEPGVECLTLDRESFTQLIGDLSELKEKDYGDEHRSLARPTSSNSFAHDLEYDYIHLDDLDVIATLGIGGFGRVELVQYSRETSLAFALKCLKKQHIVDTQQQDHVFSEKLIMMGCRSKFICRLYRTFRDAKYVYMLLEACLGGEVWTVLRDRGSFDDRTTTFVTACVVAAFDYLHGKGIIYRDLKPENLLMDSKGYVKLVDFGFAKRLPRGSKTWTFCGTPEYVAPETILNRGHDRAVDYWALGVLMHELLTGNPPFTAPDPMTTYNLILKGIVMIDFSRFNNISRSAQSLIKKLCRDSPSERLGYQRGGIQDIKKHKWFQGFDWDGLNNGTIQAPIIKGVRGPCDVSNFDCYTKDSDIPPDELSNWDIDF